MAVQVEFTEYISPDGVSYRFDSSDKFLMSESGLGMPPIEYITQKNVMQHGETLVSFRLTPRVIQLQHRRNSCSRGEYWDNRLELMDILRPNRQYSGLFAPGKLRKTLPGDIVYDIDVLVEAGPVFAARDMARWDEWAISETIRFIAHDPTFYDPRQECYSILMSDTVDELEFPFVFESPDGMLFDVSSLIGTMEIQYDGTWKSFPTIRIIGPIDEPTITNTSTDMSISLAYDISIGEYVDISLVQGNKRIINSSGTDLTYTITEDSDLVEFAIEPDPVATNGLNILSITGTNTLVDVTQINVAFYTRYIGI